MSRRFAILSLITVTGLSLIAPLQAEETQIVKGVYNNKLYEYSENGAKLGILDNISNEQIVGTRVLDRTSRGLVKIRYLDREMWLRESSLELSVSVIPPCPREAPGKSADLTTPTASGMSAHCEDR